MPNKTASKDNKSSDQQYDWMDAAVADVSRTRRARLAVKYDGVLGPPPPWFTTDTRDSFLKARERLLNEGGFDQKGYTPEVLYGLIAAVIKEHKAASDHPNEALNRDTFLVPPKDRANIYTLAGLWKLYQQGETNGTPVLLGEFLQNRVEQGQKYSAHQARNAQKPRGRVGDSKNTIGDLVRRIVRSHSDDNAKELWDRFYNILRDYQSDPEWTNKGIEYNCEDKRKSITLGRFRNIVSATRKKNSR